MILENMEKNVKKLNILKWTLMLTKIFEFEYVNLIGNILNQGYIMYIFIKDLILLRYILSTLWNESALLKCKY